MFGKGFRTRTILMTFLALFLVSPVIAEPYLTSKDLEEVEYGSQGNLYDIFRKRLQGFVSDLYSGDINEGLKFLYNTPVDANTGYARATEPQQEKVNQIEEDLNEDHDLTRECLIGQINKILHETPGAQQMSQNELENTIIEVLKETEDERSMLRDVLYEAYKTRLEQMSKYEQAVDEQEQNKVQSSLKNDQGYAYSYVNRGKPQTLLESTEPQTELRAQHYQAKQTGSVPNTLSRYNLHKEYQQPTFTNTYEIPRQHNEYKKSEHQSLVHSFGQKRDGTMRAADSKLGRRQINQDGENSKNDRCSLHLNESPLNVNLIESSAQGLNLSRDNLVRKVISMTNNTIAKNPELYDGLIDALKSHSINRVTKQAEPMSLESQKTSSPCDPPSDEQDELPSMANVSVAVILDKVLTQLERVQCDKEEAVKNESQHEGEPCDITGLFNSFYLGLQFDISTKVEERNLAPAEANNKLISITARECVPPRRHPLMSLDWKFMGSAIKQLGGPFFIYGQNRNENRIATFLGYCRTCNRIDTLFGAWTFLNPSRDCQDITASTEFRRDMMRRYRMDEKRLERIKEILYRKSNLSKEKSNVG